MEQIKFGLLGLIAGGIIGIEIALIRIANILQAFHK